MCVVCDGESSQRLTKGCVCVCVVLCVCVCVCVCVCPCGCRFLNRFDASTRYRISKLNDQLTTLGRRMDSIESSLATVWDANPQDGGE